MGRMRIAFAAAMLAVLGAALPSNADPRICAETPDAGRRYIDIDVLEQGFSPFTQQAFAGDVIRWTVRSASNHDIKPYAPATVPGFPAGVVAPRDVLCFKFAGGSIWYRDARSQNSVVTESGVCHGRCGSISDRTADPAAPGITPPSGPSQTKPTPISGTAEPLTLVKIAKLAPGDTAYDAGTPVGQALAGQDGAWSAKLDLDGGSYNLVARAVDAAGRESIDSTAAGGSVVTLEVVQDSEPPAAVAAAPTPPVVVWGQPLSGSATDNNVVAKVAVIISDLREGRQIGGDGGQSAVVINAADFRCGTGPCEPGNVQWSFKLQPTSKIVAVPPNGQQTSVGIDNGLFMVKIIAYDAWGNASEPVTFNVLVLRPATVGGG